MAKPMVGPHPKVATARGRNYGERSAHAAGSEECGRRGAHLRCQLEEQSAVHAAFLKTLGMVCEIDALDEAGDLVDGPFSGMHGFEGGGVRFQKSRLRILNSPHSHS